VLSRFGQVNPSFGRSCSDLGSLSRCGVLTGPCLSDFAARVAPRALKSGTVLRIWCLRSTTTRTSMPSKPVSLQSRRSTRVPLKVVIGMQSVAESPTCKGKTIVYVDSENPLQCGIELDKPQNIWDISLPPDDRRQTAKERRSNSEKTWIGSTSDWFRPLGCGDSHGHALRRSISSLTAHKWQYHRSHGSSCGHGEAGLHVRWTAI